MAQEASTTAAFQEIGRRSLSRDAAEQLRRAILDGTLAPGDRLPPERELAAQLGVSRPTLRGAVNALVIMGLLDSRHGSGTFVTAGAGVQVPESDGSSMTIDIGDSPLVALFELRLLFEPLAAQRAAARIEQAELDGLTRLLEELEARIDDTPEFVRLDAEFHQVIQNVAGSPLIVSVLDGISELALRVGEHAVILDALQRRDPFEASAAMTAHLMHIRATLIGQPT
jgi:GntR family transcriptional repressor for pyruvate dehydrogenase complex